MHTILLILSLLFYSITASPSQDTSQFSAVVSKNEALFTMPVQNRTKWQWRLPTTEDNQQEYRMDVTVKNEGKQYTFGFYLWKRAGASSGAGSLNDLISTGQKSLFERTEAGRMSIVREADVSVKTKDDRIAISLKGNKDLQRLFSSAPKEAVFKIKYPNEPEIVQTIPIVYQ